MNNLGNNIKAARLARGYTQQQVAKAIDLTRPTYALIEAGERDISLSQAEVLASMLRVSVDELRGAVDSAATILNTETSLEKYKQIMI